MPLKEFTFLDVYRRNAEFFPGRTAFVFEGQRITHREYLKRVERLAAGLAREGVKSGDRVAILSQNSLEMIDVIGAVARLGAILLPVNFRLNAEEIGYVLADGAPVLVVAGAEYQEIIAALKPSLPSVRSYFGIGKHTAPFAPLANLAASDASMSDVNFSADDGFVIIHTAAVGGRPRGALLSQANLLTAHSSLVQAWSLTERDVNLGVLPLFHVAGLGLMLTVQQAGGASVIASKFDPQQAVCDIAAERVTVMSEFAPMLAGLMDQAKGDELKTLRAVTGLDTPATIERFEKACPHAVFWAAFGQSETSGLATLSPTATGQDQLGAPCSGAPLRSSTAPTSQGPPDKPARSWCVVPPFLKATGITTPIPPTPSVMAGITPATSAISMPMAISGMPAVLPRKS
jgi:acyl-CoA synthetase (AMP-forming)/AMP-acid ligase II